MSPVFLTLALALVYIIFKYGRLIWNLIIMFPRDVDFVCNRIRSKLLMNYVIRNDLTVHQHFDNQVKKMPNKTCFLFENQVWTYKKVQDESYKIANYFQNQGYEKGDAIALFMQNRPEYVAIWLGLSRIGVISSLVNFNLRFKALEHCVTASKCKAIIFGTELSKAIKEVIETGGFKEQKLFSFEDEINRNEIVTSRQKNVTKEIANCEPIQTVSGARLGRNDVILNIFTSGTTGLPKAVIFTHFTTIMCSLKLRIGLRQDDVLMTPLPLYHVMGGVIGVTAALFHGIPQVLLRKFSASTFWDECVKYDCTVSLYVGEIIRYLLNQPEKPVDKMHKVRRFFGNGVNTAIWAKFIERFNKITLIEVYGCTEGCVTTTISTGHIKACGFHPIWALSMVSVCIAKVDFCTKEILRDEETGLVQMAEIGEPGEYLGKIIPNDAFQEFIGYTDREATEKKIIRNVKIQGDAWFKSGDILQRDEIGYLYFKDRTGDTFRWKGETVSTTEIQAVVTKASGMKASVVYGVEIPETEGRCGMAAISDPEGTLDLGKLATELMESLPNYSIPLFLRIIRKEINVSGTFKLQKWDLQKEGFNITEIQDSIYFLKEKRYVPLNLKLYSQIISGSIRV